MADLNFSSSLAGLEPIRCHNHHKPGRGLSLGIIILRFTHRHLVILVQIGGLALAGCEGSGKFGAAAGPMKKVDGQKSSGDEKSADDENEKANVPQEVSGAFLTCAFMESRSDFENHVATSPNSDVHIGCGLYRRSDLQPVDTSLLGMQPQVLTYENKLIDLKFSRMPRGAPLQVETTVPVQYLSGTIYLNVSRNGKYVRFKKSIPTIRSFDAQYQFSIADDMRVQGITFNQDGTASNISAGVAPVNTDKQSSQWWVYVVKAISNAFGNAASVPPTNDIGTDIYRPTSNNNTKINGDSGGVGSTATNGGNASYDPGFDDQVIQAQPTWSQPAESSNSSSTGGSAEGVTTSSAGNTGSGDSSSHWDSGSPDKGTTAGGSGGTTAASGGPQAGSDASASSSSSTGGGTSAGNTGTSAGSTAGGSGSGGSSHHYP